MTTTEANVTTCELNPLDDRLVVQADPMPDMRGGLILPNAANRKPDHGTAIGTVVKVGPGKWIDGRRIPLQVGVGDRVLYGWYGGFDVEDGGVKYKMLTESDVLMRLGNAANQQQEG